ncbi:glutamate racemase [Clostridium sp. CTA-19]
MNLSKGDCIGFFDSGVGGLSVLKETLKILPNENFIYYGDSANAPYGTKEYSEIKKLTFDAIKFLLSKNVKAIVIACNTATSVAVEDLRKEYKSIPIIGIEPALKPAVELKKQGQIVIMATPITLVEKKFAKLQEKYKKVADIKPLPCGGLAELIETGNIDGIEIHNYLKEKLENLSNENLGTIVLGCTHYPFIKDKIVEFVGKNVDIIDGSLGTAKQLERLLTIRNMKNPQSEKGIVEIYNSLNKKEMIELSYRLLNS